MAVDLPLYFLLGALILTLIIVGPLLRTRLRRRANEAGANAGTRFAAGKLAAVLDDFGATLTILAPEAVTRDLLGAAVEGRQKDYVVRSDGDYGVRFLEPDDTIVRLVAEPEGTRMQVATFREYMGFPQTAPLWEDLRARVASAAADRGIAVTNGPTTRFVRAEAVDDRNARWRADA